MTYAIGVTSNVKYGIGAANLLDIYTPIGAPTPRAAFICIHGGGWQQGDKTQIGLSVDAPKLIAGLGHTVFNINYRLVKNGNVNILPNPNVVNPAPAALADAQLAVRWVRSKIGLYQLISNKIFSFGFSAGAHIAAYLGIQDTIIAGTSVSGRLPGFSPMVDGVSAHSCPSDLATAITGPHNETDDAEVITFVNAAAIEANTAAYNLWSPSSLVSGISKKMYIAQGTEDTIVLEGQATGLRDALIAAGVPVVLYTYAGGHVYSGVLKAVRNTVIQNSVEWLV